MVVRWYKWRIEITITKIVMPGAPATNLTCVASLGDVTLNEIYKPRKERYFVGRMSVVIFISLVALVSIAASAFAASTISVANATATIETFSFAPNSLKVAGALPGISAAFFDPATKRWVLKASQLSPSAVSVKAKLQVTIATNPPIPTTSIVNGGAITDRNGVLTHVANPCFVKGYSALQNEFSTFQAKVKKYAIVRFLELANSPSSGLREAVATAMNEKISALVQQANQTITANTYKLSQQQRSIINAAAQSVTSNTAAVERAGTSAALNYFTDDSGGLIMINTVESAVQKFAQFELTSRIAKYNIKFRRLVSLCQVPTVRGYCKNAGNWGHMYTWGGETGHFLNNVINRGMAGRVCPALSTQSSYYSPQNLTPIFVCGYSQGAGGKQLFGWRYKGSSKVVVCKTSKNLHHYPTRSECAQCVASQDF